MNPLKGSILPLAADCHWGYLCNIFLSLVSNKIMKFKLNVIERVTIGQKERYCALPEHWVHKYI